MKDDFFKFPSTPHLAVSGGFDIRTDKVMLELEQAEFLQQQLVVEEKVDGANLGISFDADGEILTQNRGAYLNLPYPGQWKKLGEWLASRIDPLFECLTDRYILFGEWCYAQHSIRYTRLPDWFLGFDVYDKQCGRFLSTAHRDEILKAIQVAQVPALAAGCFTLTELERFLAQSKLSDQPAEGLYFRFDQGEWLAQRAKLVRPEFIQSVGQHWSRSLIRPNQLNEQVNEWSLRV